jgi:hypothetical protein
MPVFISYRSCDVESVFDWLRGQGQPTPEVYMRGMALLELLWRQTIPDLSLEVVDDKPEQLPDKSTWIAIALFGALQQNPAQEWFVKHIRNAVVHSASAADAIAVIGDSIHFYQVKAVSEGLGKRVFDRLTPRQKQDLAELYAGRDAQQEFAGLVTSHLAEDRLRGISDLFGQVVQPHRFKLVLTKTAEDHSDSGDGSNDGDWSDELNERRIELIDKDIQANITTEERAELAELQRKAVAYRDRVAPLPIEGARRLHQQLLEKKLQQEGS